MGPVRGFDEASADPTFVSAGLMEKSPMPDDTTVAGVGPWHPSLGKTPERPAPRAGEHTQAIFEEFGIRKSTSPPALAFQISDFVPVHTVINHQ